MAKKKSLLERMESNPADGWTIDDFEKLCAEQGLEWTTPTRGSHFKVASEYLNGILTIPYNRPVKVVYVKRMCSMIKAHLSAKEREIK
ncbi:type II toxin-antitoxin system HicA family toxin [Rhizobium leguminosarum bv. viciae]|uniref:type II toxin-antitoxin system HicA family toxin n=1 Tax=Rhizobium leguminosarum TaxID=384 RepID=UPI001441D71B|nr:type II toxin-antitoxin system HicA family toxin [Rhizobium leguminosarum]NKJ90564.1 type II toxin-antitoxin system HicA family toxin [Rhizobium leguminosarum bv. viciae]